jgi:hypothetical protein
VSNKFSYVKINFLILTAVNKIMKLKIFSLAIMAILAISVTGIVVTEDSAQNVPSAHYLDDKIGFYFAALDYSTTNGRYLDLKVYDNNNNQIATYHSTFTHQEKIYVVILPENTAYIDVDVAVWKVNSALRDGHWNHVFTNRLDAKNLTFKYADNVDSTYGTREYDYGNQIQTSGTVYGSSANYGVQAHVATHTSLITV